MLVDCDRIVLDGFDARQAIDFYQPPLCTAAFGSDLQDPEELGERVPFGIYQDIICFQDEGVGGL